MNHIVSSCNDCPFLSKYLDYEYRESIQCNYPTLKIISIEQDEKESPITPDNCPLKKGILTIVFDDKD